MYIAYVCFYSKICYRYILPYCFLPNIGYLIGTFDSLPIFQYIILCLLFYVTALPRLLGAVLRTFLRRSRGRMTVPLTLYPGLLTSECNKSVIAQVSREQWMLALGLYAPCVDINNSLMQRNHVFSQSSMHS